MSETISSINDLSQLSNQLENLESPVSLVLREGRDDSGFCSRLREIADQVLSATEGTVAVHTKNVPDDTNTPALSILKAGREVAWYQAIPEGPEEAPFAMAIAALADDAAESEPNAAMGHDRRKHRIEVFVAPGCPNCPHGVIAALSLATQMDTVSVAVIDASHFTERALKFNVRSVPTTVVDDGLTLVGVRSEKELLENISELDGPGADDAIFVSLVKSGRVDAATTSLVTGKGHTAFSTLWNNSTLEERISLSLVAQNAVDEEPESLDGLVPLILPSLNADDTARRGDTADLLGAIGHPDARPALEALLDDENPDVAEAAQDALEDLRDP